MANTTIRTNENRMRVLRALANGGSYTKAADAAGVSRDALFRWKADDEDFNAQCLDAIEQGTDRLEDVAIQRAVEGSSDTMLIFTLKGRRREKWGDKQQVEHSGNVTVASALDAATERLKKLGDGA
jgi:hypothetical protein